MGKSWSKEIDPVHESADFIKKRFVEGFAPRILIICGSGLGRLSESIDTPVEIDYKDIPNFPNATAPGHKGKLVLGYLQDVPVVCMAGRFHFYEGHSLQQATMPVRVASLLGVDFMIVTNASGGLNPQFNVCDIMLMDDHINFLGMAGHHPLIGANDPSFGVRFPAMSHAYDEELRGVAIEEARRLGITEFFRSQGTYACVSGPSYETPHELALLRNNGADSVGMSTVHEAIVARHCGLRILGLSLITNKCVLPGDDDTPPPNEEEVLESGEKRREDIEHLVKAIVPRMQEMNAAEDRHKTVLEPPTCLQVLRKKAREPVGQWVLVGLAVAASFALHACKHDCCK